MQVFRQVLMQARQHFDGRDVALLPSILLVVGSKFVLSHLHLTVHLGLCPEPLAVPALPLALPPISSGEEPSPALGNSDGSSFVAQRVRQKDGTDGPAKSLRDC
jgi:hypothetical protein